MVSFWVNPIGFILEQIAYAIASAVNTLKNWVKYRVWQIQSFIDRMVNLINNWWVSIYNDVKNWVKYHVVQIQVV